MKAEEKDARQDKREGLTPITVKSFITHVCADVEEFLAFFLAYFFGDKGERPMLPGSFDALKDWKTGKVKVVFRGLPFYPDDFIKSCLAKGVIPVGVGGKNTPFDEHIREGGLGRKAFDSAALRMAHFLGLQHNQGVMRLVNDITKEDGEAGAGIGHLSNLVKTIYDAGGSEIEALQFCFGWFERYFRVQTEIWQKATEEYMANAVVQTVSTPHRPIKVGEITCSDPVLIRQMGKVGRSLSPGNEKGAAKAVVIQNTSSVIKTVSIVIQQKVYKTNTGKMVRISLDDVCRKLRVTEEWLQELDMSYDDESLLYPEDVHGVWFYFKNKFGASISVSNGNLKITEPDETQIPFNKEEVDHLRKIAGRPNRTVKGLKGAERKKVLLENLKIENAKKKIEAFDCLAEKGVPCTVVDIVRANVKWEVLGGKKRPTIDPKRELGVDSPEVQDLLDIMPS